MDSPPGSHYVGNAGQDYHYHKRGIPSQALPWVEQSRADKIQPYIAAEQDVLEFGVGSGWNLARLRCHRKTGIDVSDFLAAELRGKGIEFFQSMEELPAASFDRILFHHSLEHLPNPLLSLASAKRVLRPDGRILIFVPFEKEQKYRRFDPREPNHHLFSWNVQTMGNLLSEAGYQVVDIGLRRYGWDRFLAKVALKLHLGESGFKLLQAVALAVNPLLEVFAIGVPNPEPKRP